MNFPRSCRPVERVFSQDICPCADCAVFWCSGNDSVSRSAANEIILNDDKFWIVSRNELFGPFDYQWSGDLYGIEFNYQGEKFGEVCSDEEFFADLKPFGLPLSVARVAALTAGVIAFGIRAGSSLDERVSHLISLLQKFDLGRFQIRESSPRPD